MGTEALVGQILQMQDANRRGAQDWLNTHAQKVRMDSLGRKFMANYSFTPQGLEKFAKDEGLDQQQLMQFVQIMKQFEDYRKAQVGTKQAQQDLTQGATRFGREGETYEYEKAGRMTPEQLAKKNALSISGTEAAIDQSRAATESSRASAGYHKAMADYVASGGKDKDTTTDLKRDELERTRKLSAMATMLDSIAGEKGSVTFSPDYGFEGVVPESSLMAIMDMAEKNGYTIIPKKTGDKTGGFAGIGGEPMYKISIAEKGMFGNAPNPQPDMPEGFEYEKPNIKSFQVNNQKNDVGDSAIKKLQGLMSGDTPPQEKEATKGDMWVDEKTGNIMGYKTDSLGHRYVAVIMRKPFFKNLYKNTRKGQTAEAYISPKYQEYLDMVEKLQ